MDRAEAIAIVKELLDEIEENKQTRRGEWEVPDYRLYTRLAVEAAEEFSRALKRAVENGSIGDLRNYLQDYTP